MATAAIATALGGTIASAATNVATSLGTSAYNQALYEKNRQHIEDTLTSEGLPKSLMYIPPSGNSTIHNYLGQGTYRDVSMFASGKGSLNALYPQYFNFLKAEEKYKATKPEDPLPSSSTEPGNIEQSPAVPNNTTRQRRISTGSESSGASTSRFDPDVKYLGHFTREAAIFNRWRSVNKFK